jgi:phosphate transport system substrate-binding protein
MINLRFAESAAAAAMLFVFMTGCSSSGSTSQQTVSTDGSTSMEKVIGYLSEAYMEENSGVRVSYNPTGSGSGIQAVLDGRCDIGLSSRELTEAEKEELKADAAAVDGIAVIVNPDNPVTDITSVQLAGIYTGEITNWQEIGGENLPIVCIGREAASGTRDGFESITGTVGLCKYSQELTSTGDVVQTVASNPGAIGYASLETVGEKAEILKIDGVMPSEETILDGSYGIRREFLLVTPKNKELSAAAQDFFDFVMSGAGNEFIRKAGAIPVA